MGFGAAVTGGQHDLVGLAGVAGLALLVVDEAEVLFPAAGAGHLFGGALESGQGTQFGDVVALGQDPHGRGRVGYTPASRSRTRRSWRARMVARVLPAMPAPRMATS
ncbi:Uncharacterised protein [Mycobacteroides abscessus subsp. abscessus]|nr:Uncharacterised protein [Mycobacteroides abscessus subsp. abscessus]